MATAASDDSSEHIRADTTAAVRAAPPPPSSAFLWSGYHWPHPLQPPSPLPDFSQLSAWPLDPLRVFAWWYGEAERYYQRLLAAQSEWAEQAVAWPNNMQLATADGSGQPHVRNVLLKGVDAAGLIFFTNRAGAKGRQLAANGKAAVVFYWKGLERQVRVEGDMVAVSDEESDGYFHSRAVGSQISAAVSPQSAPISSRAALEEHYVQQINQLAQAASQSDATAMAPSSVSIDQLPSLSSASAPTAHPAAAAGTSGVSASDAHSHHKQALATLARLQQQQQQQQQSAGGSGGEAGGLQWAVRRPAHWGGYRLVPRLFEFWEDGQYRLHSRVEYSRRADGPDGAAAEQQQPPKQRSTAESEWDKRFLAP